LPASTLLHLCGTHSEGEAREFTGCAADKINGHHAKTAKSLGIDAAQITGLADEGDPSSHPIAARLVHRTCLLLTKADMRDLKATSVLKLDWG
jgi:hypothetical protein